MTKRHFLILGIALALLAAVGAVVAWQMKRKASADAEPKELAAALIRAIAAEDYGAVYDLTDQKTRADMEKEVKALKADAAKMTPEERKAAELPDNVEAMTPRDHFVLTTRKELKRGSATSDRFKSLGAGSVGVVNVAGASGRVRLVLGPPLGGEGSARVVLEEGRWRIADLAFFAENERQAVAGLQDIYEGEAAFNSRAGDSMYWVGDVRGIYAGIIKGQPVCSMIGSSVPAADPAALGPGEWDLDGDGAPDFRIDAEGIDRAGAKLDARQGYYFRVVPLDENGKPYATISGVASREKFAFCAYPSEYGALGVKSYAINETGTVFVGDTSGKPVEKFPKDWKPVP